MSNMSYCRFQNTSHDLSDCIEALEEMSEALYDDESDSDQTSLSAEEEQARRWMIELCESFLEKNAEYEDNK